MEQTSVVGSENGLRHKVSVPNTLGLNGRLVEALELGLRGRDETAEAIQKFGEEMADIAHLRARLPLVIALAIVDRVRYPVVYKIPTSDIDLSKISSSGLSLKKKVWFYLDHFVVFESESLSGKSLEIFNLVKGESIKGHPLPVCIVCQGDSAYISIDIADILANVG